MLLILLLSSLLSDVQTDRFTVYLSAPLRDGFVDTSKDIQDSIGDVRSKLLGMKEFQIVDQREKADIILTIVTRGVGSIAYGRRVSYREYYNNAVLTSLPIVANTYWVATVMEVGKYKKEFSGAYTNQARSSMGAWGQCAKQIVNDLKAWAVANAAQLKRKRPV